MKIPVQLLDKNLIINTFYFNSELPHKEPLLEISKPDYLTPPDIPLSRRGQNNPRTIL